MTRRPGRLTATGGSDERQARSMVAPLLRFDLPGEADRLRAETAYRDGDRNAKTLVKEGAFRLVLVALRSGARFDEDDQRGSLALQVLEGRVTLRVGEEATELGAGEVAVVSPDHPWRAVALSDGLLLMQLSWPPAPGSVAPVAPGLD
jgi:quercetin dioxygenase-like cupin family protein